MALNFASGRGACSGKHRLTVPEVGASGLHTRDRERPQVLSQFTSAPNQGLGQEAGRKPKGAVAGSAQARAGGVSDAGELVAAFDAAPRPAQTAQTTEGVRAGSFNLSTEKSCDRGQPPAFLSNTAGSNLQNGVFDGNSSSINSRNSPPYTSSANSRLGEIERVEFQLVGCRCKSSSCSRCGPLKGWRLSQELAAELERFKFPQLWTLTVDPAACPDPRKIYDHLAARAPSLRRPAARSE